MKVKVIDLNHSLFSKTHRPKYRSNRTPPVHRTETHPQKRKVAL
ncbi:hypothetical protein [Vibrio sp. Y2-5]|nr:hypothetical protein [Vibrio sp. Y2-5]